MFPSRLAALLVLALLQAPAPAATLPEGRAWSGRTWPTHVVQRADSKFGKAIHRILAPGNLRGRAQDDVVAELLRLGPDSVPALFAHFSGTMEGPFPDVTERPPADEDAVLPPVPDEEAILIATLRQHSAERVVSAVASATVLASVDVKLVGMRVLGQVGGASAVDAWIDTMTTLEPIHLERLFVQTPTEGALARILETGDAAFELLAQRASAVEPRLLPSIVRALGASDRSSGIDVLLALLGHDANLDAVLLAELGRLAERTVGAPDESTLARIRPFTSHADWRVRREAISTLARVHAVDAHPVLVAALDDEERLIAETAAWALRKLSGLDLGGDTAAWTSWFEREHEWWITAGAHAIEALGAEDRKQVLAAVGELQSRRLYRHEAARAIAPLLERDDPELAVAIASALGGLGSRTAREALVRALESRHESVRMAAWGALKLITRRDLPLEPHAWADVVR